MDHTLVPVAEHNMSDSRSCLLIQADTLLVVQADMEKGSAAPAHANIDMPLAAVALTNVHVGDRATWRAERRQFTF